VSGILGSALLADFPPQLWRCGNRLATGCAFLPARRPPSERLTYGYGRTEDANRQM